MGYAKVKAVADTSIWMSDIDFYELINKYNIIIPYVVLQEINNLKNNKEKSYYARRAIRFIDGNYDELQFIDAKVNESDKNDDKIISTAEFYKCAIITNDIGMRIKSKVLGVPVVEIECVEDDYKGYQIFEMDTNDDESNKILASIYESPNKNIWDLYTNQYLIIRDKNSKKTIDTFRWSGSELLKLKLPPKKIINPLNDFQACALDLLHNKNIPIKFIIGEIGSGKTHLATKLGFYYTIDKGLYNKIFVCRNPIGAGENIGALPGDKIDKVGEFYTPIEENTNITNIDKYIDCGQVEFNVPFFIKGNTYDNTWMIVDESEDFDIKTMRLVGGRIGKNSCISFCGDYLQAEKKFEKNNGLKYAVNKLKGNPLVGIIFLEENVRSDASSVFLKL